MESRHTPFSSLPTVGQEHHLFSVNPGTPVSFVLETASCMLNNARETLRLATIDLPPGDGSAQACSAFYVIEQVAGLLESVQLAIPETLSTPEVSA